MSALIFIDFFRSPWKHLFTISSSTRKVIKCHRVQHTQRLRLLRYKHRANFIWYLCSGPLTLCNATVVMNFTTLAKRSWDVHENTCKGARLNNWCDLSHAWLRLKEKRERKWTMLIARVTIIKDWKQHCKKKKKERGKRTSYRNWPPLRAYSHFCALRPWHWFYYSRSKFWFT